jgi:hypothetical protein
MLEWPDTDLRIESVVHIDGSILWHAARPSALVVPELPDKTMDMILR